MSRFLKQSPSYPVRILIAMGVLLLSFALIYTWLQKTVEITIDGQSQRLTVFDLKVTDLLRSENISLAEADLITPAPSHWLREGDTVTIQRAVQVPILAGSVVQVILTASRVPSYILTQAGIPYSSTDLLLANGKPVSFDQPLAKDPHTGRFPSLQLRRLVPFSISDGSKTETFQSSASTLGLALWQEGIRLSTVDSVDPALDTPPQPGLQAVLQRARSILVALSGQEYPAQVVAATVGEALSKMGLSMQALDYSIPSEDSPIPEDGMIRVVRVREETLLEQAPLPFKNQYQAVSDLEIDSQKILQAGEFGLNVKRIRIRYEDNLEVSREVEEEWTARQPKDRIIGYGTSLVEHTATTSDGTISYWRIINMYAVSYNPTSAGGSITASGRRLEKGVVAVDPRYIPLGTRLYIPGYGEAIAADTGGAVKGRIIDLGYSDEDYEAWHQNVSVYFLWPPPGNVVWIFP